MHLTLTNIISHACKYFNSEVAASRSEVMPCGIVKSRRFAYCVKLSVPHIVPKAHFTHEVRFTCEAYFTFRASGTLSSKNAPWSVDKSAFFVGAPGGIRTLDLPVRSRALYPLSYKRIRVLYPYPIIIAQKCAFVNRKIRNLQNY